MDSESIFSSVVDLNRLEWRTLRCGAKVIQNDSGELVCSKCGSYLIDEPSALFDGPLEVKRFDGARRRKFGSRKKTFFNKIG